MDAETRHELSRLADAVSSLEERMVALEESAVRRRVETRAPLSEADTEDAGFSGAFAKLALVCFSLVGALLLRVATQQGLIDDTAGTTIGLSYCAFLSVAPLLLRSVAVVTAHGAVLQYAGILLAPLIVMEMFHRHDVFDVLGATLVLSLAGATGCVLGGLRDNRGLSAIGLFAAAAGIAGLGLEPAGAGVRASALVGLTACGFVSAHLRSWVGVRPAVLLPTLAALGLGILMTARRDNVPAEVSFALIAGAVATWVLVLLNHVARRARMADGEAAWLVIVSLWCGALVRFAVPSGAVAGTVAAAALLAVGYVMARAQTGRTAVTAAVAGGALAVISLPGLDPTALGLGFVPLALWAINRTQASDAFDVLGGIAAVTATFGALPALVDVPASGFTLLFSSLFLGSALVGHWAARGVTTRTRPFLAPVSLVAGWVLLFLGGRALLFDALGESDGFHLAVTLELATFALVSQALGKRLESKTWLVAGVVGIGLLAIKSVLWDLFHLGGAYATGSVVALGVASGVTSFILRRRSAR